MNIKIEKYDNQGRGIGYLNKKIVFVPNTVIGETVEIEIVEEKEWFEGWTTSVVNVREKPSEESTIIMLFSFFFINCIYFRFIFYKEITFRIECIIIVISSILKN